MIYSSLSYDLAQNNMHTLDREVKNLKTKEKKWKTKKKKRKKLKIRFFLKVSFAPIMIVYIHFGELLNFNI